MKPFAWNLMIGLIWVALTGTFTATNLLIGIVIGYLILAFAGTTVGARGYATVVWRRIGFFLFYLGELLLSNLRVARDVIRPRSHARPAIIAIPVDGLSPFQITLLANLITMTPGTLSIDTSDDEKTLYIHAMFVSDVQKLRDEIEHGLTRRVRELVP